MVWEVQSNTRHVASATVTVLRYLPLFLSATVLLGAFNLL